MEAMVAHPNSPANAHPVQHQRHNYGLPCEEERRGKGASVEDYQRDRGDPIDLVRVTEFNDFGM